MKALYYLMVLLLLLPWWLLLFGALRRKGNGGLGRGQFQAEGAVLLIIASTMQWIANDMHIRPLWGEESEKLYALNYGENGLFLIGGLLFVLGFFFTRQRQPGWQPWPEGGKLLSLLFILLGLVFASAAYSTQVPPWLNLPWSMPRMFMTMGCLPFTLNYLLVAQRHAHLAALHLPNILDTAAAKQK